MKNATRLFSLLLAVCMLFTLAACGAQGGNEITTQTTAAATNAEVTDAAETEAADVPEWLNTDSALPIVKEGYEKTLKVYVEQTTDYGEVENSWMYKYITQVMNIKLDVTTYTPDNKKDFLSLAFASNTLPDIIIAPNYSTAELLNYGEIEGQLLDMVPYINETYMPNLTSVFEAFPDAKVKFTTPNGNIWALGKVSAGGGTLPRYFMNYDYLDELGLKAPTTLDEFIDDMRAVKAAGLCEYPIGGGYSSEHPGAFILNAMGYVGANSKAYGIALRNGKVVLPLADREAFGDYLKVMNQLYEEGLIHPDFFTMDRNSIFAEFAKNQAFIFQAPYYCASDPDQYWPVAPLTSQWNDTPVATGYSKTNPEIVTGTVVVTSACKEPELAAKFLDWFYSMTEANFQTSMIGPKADDTEHLFGLDGWTTDENGIVYLPGYENNKDKYTTSNDYLVKNIALWSSGAFGFDTWGFDENSPTYAAEPDASQYEDPSVLRKDETLNASGDKLFQYSARVVMTPYVTAETFPAIVWMDAEQASELATTLAALRSYAKPEIAKFITGARELTDAELDDYFTNLENLGALEYVQAYQDYYDSVHG